MKRLYSDLREMTDLVTEMGELVTDMLSGAIDALVNSNEVLADEVKKKYERVAFLDSLIEDEALRILILYQPMASDMRFTATALKLITYLERIGKHSKNIAKAAIFLKDRPTKYFSSEIYAMCDLAVEMVKGVITAFETKNIEGLESYHETDDKMDRFRITVIEENVKHIMEDPRSVEAYTYYISLAKYLERVGDNACKIAEKIIYMVSGKHVEVGDSASAL
ncbi:MAG: phosphate signaling complex protein PhoU [Methanomassiliicoccaceae archaeon]|nr:phosphate signaling complex protein PhoU [Methanomassiliicoccaceae archaeon]